MPSPLIEHITRYTHLDKEQQQKVDQVFTIHEYPKKKLILSERQRNIPLCFIVKGCLRLFSIDEKGKEQITHFAIENWWLTDFTAFGNQEPASFSMETIEPCIIASIHHESLEQLSKQVPEINHYFRINLHRALGAAQNRVRLKYTLSKEQRFFNFADNYPDFVQRIPQYMLASFLGLTPEYISKLRRKRRNGPGK